MDTSHLVCHSLDSPLKHAACTWLRGHHADIMAISVSMQTPPLPMGALFNIVDKTAVINQ